MNTDEKESYESSDIKNINEFENNNNLKTSVKQFFADEMRKFLYEIIEEGNV